MNPIDCLCAGIVVADFVCAPVARLPGAGELVLSPAIEMAIGGCASNVAVDLARLGWRVAAAGRTGSDAAGQFLRDTLGASGVDTKYLSTTDACGTSSTLIINVKGEDRRFIHAAGANSAFDGSEITRELIAGARALYLGGFCLMPRLTGKRASALFRLAREAGVPTVLDVVIPDPAGWLDELEQVLPWTDVFLPNTDEARLLTGLDNPKDQAERFAALGATTTVITCGAEGAYVADGARRFRSRSFPVEFVDGTGSGDAFAAGFIHGLLEGASIERCLEFGSALGASCVRRTGATAGVFTRAELDAFLAGNRLEIAAAQ